jgi:hypothetical protein
MAVAEMEVAAEAESRRWVEKPFFFGGGREESVFLFFVYFGAKGVYEAHDSSLLSLWACLSSSIAEPIEAGSYRICLAQ